MSLVHPESLYTVWQFDLESPNFTSADVKTTLLVQNIRYIKDINQKLTENHVMSWEKLKYSIKASTLNLQMRLNGAHTSIDARMLYDIFGVFPALSPDFMLILV